jgi:hypothetical protein
MWISKKEYGKMKALAEGRKCNIKGLNKQVTELKQLEKAQDRVIEVDNRLIAAQRELIACLMKIIDHLEKNSDTIKTSNQ